MKLYTSIGPNPHVVRMFIAEKGIDVPTEQIDLMTGENRQEGFLKRNPMGQSPCLELDDGSYLAEITAICEYLDEEFPEKTLIGANAKERAETRMWTRRIDLNIIEPMTNGFRFAEGLPMFKDRMRCIPEAADGLKAMAQDKLTWLDQQMGGKDFICGDRFTLADILLYCFQAFANQVGQPLNPDLKNLKAWFERVSQRPSAKA